MIRCPDAATLTDLFRSALAAVRTTSVDDAQDRPFELNYGREDGGQVVVSVRCSLCLCDHAVKPREQITGDGQARVELLSHFIESGHAAEATR